MSQSSLASFSKQMEYNVVEYKFQDNFADLYANGINVKLDDSRDAKGFKFEMFVQNICSIIGVSYSAHPTQYSNWLSFKGGPFDIEVKLELKTLKVECKYTANKIEHSWFVRDWLSRDCDVIVTNDPSAIKYNDKRALAKKGTKLLSPTEFAIYLQDLIDANQLSSWNNYTNDILSKIYSKISSIFNRRSNLKAKSRLKTALCEANAPVKSGNPESLPEVKGAKVECDYNGVPISSDRISSLLDKIDSTRESISIRAVKLKKEDFYKIIENNAVKNSDGTTNATAEDMKNSKGFYLKVSDSDYVIALMEDTAEAETLVLIRELSKIAWKDWEVFVGWKYYVC